MILLEYRKSLSELDIILGCMDIDHLNKIPKKLYDFIQLNKDDSFIPNIDKNIPICEQKIQNKTKILLSLIYRRYWCENYVKKELLKQDVIQKELYEAEQREKNNTNNLFMYDVLQEKTTTISSQNAVQLIEYKKENILIKFIKRIKIRISNFSKK